MDWEGWIEEGMQVPLWFSVLSVVRKKMGAKDFSPLHNLNNRFWTPLIRLVLSFVDSKWVWKIGFNNIRIFILCGIRIVMNTSFSMKRRIIFFLQYAHNNPYSWEHDEDFQKWNLMCSMGLCKHYGCGKIIREKM